MKRLFCVLLIAFLLLPSAVLADLPDLSSYSHDELLLLNDHLQQILFDASLPDGILVPAGTYIVGVDIPAGDYRADVVSDVGGGVTVYASKETAEAHPLSYLDEFLLGNMWGTLVFRLKIEDGNYLEIKSNSLRLYPYKGLLDLSVPKE